MTTFFQGNFDFEHHLRRNAAPQLPEAIRRLNAELACVWLAVAEEGDLILLPEPVEPGFFDMMRATGFAKVHTYAEGSDVPVTASLCAWGWTDAVRTRAAAGGWSVTAPSQDAVTKVNSRVFAAELEREWNVAPPGSVAVRSLDDLTNAIQNLPVGCGRWVVKAIFGMSARERILGNGNQPTDQVINWTRKRLAADGVVLFEPWLQRIDEAGLQWTIPKSGKPVLAGITPLLTDAAGQYRGSRFEENADLERDWASALETGFLAAKRIQKAGYCGPLGIDAMRYRDADGNTRMRPLQDINARYSMGRLSLGFRRMLASGEFGSWLHVRWADDTDSSPDEWWNRMTGQLPDGVHAVRTSPFVVGDRPVAHGTLVLIASTQEQQQSAEYLLLHDTVHQTHP